MRLERLSASARDAHRTDAALAIYQETILPEARNPEREILYWIEHSERGGANELFCFAIEDDRRVVGYLQYSYFANIDCAFLEYVCVAAGAVAGTSLLEAFLQQLTRAHPGWKAVVGEVAFQKSLSSSWREDRVLLRLAARYGFGRLDIPYRYPALNSGAREPSHPADLVVAVRTGDSVQSDYALDIMRAIYFDHYLAWDRPFKSEHILSERETLFARLYNEQAAAISGRQHIGLETTVNPRFSTHRV